MACLAKTHFHEYIDLHYFVPSNTFAMKLATSLLTKRIVPKGTALQLKLLHPLKMREQQPQEPMAFQVHQAIKTLDTDFVLIQKQAPAFGLRLGESPHGPQFSQLRHQLLGRNQREAEALLSSNNLPTEFVEAADQSPIAIQIQGPKPLNPFQGKGACPKLDKPPTEDYTLPKGTVLPAQTIEDAEVEVEDWLGLLQAMRL